MMKLLNFIKKYVKKNKYYPTYQEMADALDFKSKNSVTVLITKLEQRKKLLAARIGLAAFFEDTLHEFVKETKRKEENNKYRIEYDISY